METGTITTAHGAGSDNGGATATGDAPVLMLLSRDAILSRQDRVFDFVDVPEWGGKVRIRSLSGRERDAFETAIAQRRGKNVSTNLDNIRARFAAAVVVDKNGEPIFSEADVVKLGEKHSGALDRIFEKGRRLSGMTQDDVNELAGNSDATRGDGSSSASPSSTSDASRASS